METLYQKFGILLRKTNLEFKRYLYEKFYIINFELT